jgi:hypothetical protein
MTLASIQHEVLVIIVQHILSSTRIVSFCIFLVFASHFACLQLAAAGARSTISSYRCGATPDRSLGISAGVHDVRYSICDSDVIGWQTQLHFLRLVVVLSMMV